MRILIVEDDQLIAQALTKLLKKHYVIDVVATVEDAGYMMDVNEYDLGVIDIGLPDGSGIELCKLWRQEHLQQPILVLTGESSVQAKVLSLESGADDHLCKPFHPEELVGRIRALLRRSTKYQSHVYNMTDYSFDATNKQLRQGSLNLQLNCKEGQLLELLFRHQGSIVTRAMIVEHVWEDTDDLATNTIEVHMSRLRRRISKHFGMNCIKTIRNVGYSIPISPVTNQIHQKGGEKYAKNDIQITH